MPDFRPRLPNLLAAAAPGLLIAALLFPATYDPLAPLESAPAVVWLLLLAATAALLAAAALGRTNPVPRLAAVTTLALGIALFAALSLAEPLLVFDDRRAGFAIFAAVIAAGAGAWAILSIRRAPLLFLVAVGVLEGLLGGAMTHGRPTRAHQLLRQAMYVAPGWGMNSLAGLERRSLLRPWTLGNYARDLRRLESEIASADQHNAFDVPDDAWQDDAHLIRGWLLLKIAAAPDAKPDESAALLRRAAQERLRFARDPLAAVEPFTAGGILYQDALRLTDDIRASDALRLRIATAWSALELFSTRAPDPVGEDEAISLLRSLFDENRLDRLEPLYLETFSLEARGFIASGDAPGYLALFDGLAADKRWPDALRKKFAERSEFLRSHSADGYAPALLYLRAQDALAREEDPSPFLDELRKRFPDDPLAKAPAAALAPDR